MDTYKKLFLVLLIIILLFLIIGFIAGVYFYNLALNPAYDKSAVLDAPHNQLTPDDNIPSPGNNTTVSKAQWLKTVGYQDIYHTTDDGLQLHAYQITQDNNEKWALLAHGYTGNARQMAGSGMRFYEMGFNLILPDARGHGLSEGDYIGMGWHERLDMVRWIDEILSINPNAQIILYGISMGAATVMMTAGEPLPANVKAIIEDCGYTSVKEEFSYQLKALFGIPSFPVINFASAVTRLKAGYTLTEADAASQVAKATTPMLFIHGDADTFVPAYMADILYEKAPVEKEKLIIRGAGHGEASQVDNTTYWNTIQAFITRYISL